MLYMYTFICMNKHTHIYIYTYTYVHTYIHTYRPTDRHTYVFELNRFWVILCLGANGVVKGDVKVLHIAHAVDAILQIKWSVPWG